MERISLLGAGLLFLAGASVLGAAGAVTGRKMAAADRIAARCLPAAFLLSLLSTRLWGGQLCALFHVTQIVYVGGMAVLTAAVAVWAAFRPGKAAYAAGAAVSLIGMVSWISSAVLFPLTCMAGAAICAAAWFLSCMGLAIPHRPERKEAGGQTLKPEPPGQAGPEGFLLMLSGYFAGGQVPVPSGEELRLGNDARYCHLVLDQPGGPPCLCGVRFLEKRGTYLVTCYAPEALIDGTGRALPENSSVEVRPGTVFENAVDQSPLFQTG